MRSRINERTAWWLALAVLLLIGGTLRFTGYNFSLPYVDHPDEPNFSLAAQMIIDTGTSKPLHYEGYPPGIITLNYLFLRFFHDPTTPPSTVIWMIRLLSITASLVLLVVIALLGRLLTTPSAGLLAALLWAINPTAIEHARYATADTFVALFTVLAVYLVLAGVIYRRDGWVTAGIVTNLLGIVFKYQSGFVLPLLLLVSLTPLLEPNADRRHIRDKFILRALIVGAFAFWLVLIYPSLDANQIPYWVAPTNNMSLPSADRLLQGINLLVTTNAAGWLLAALAAAGIALSRRHLWRIGGVAAALLFWLFGVGLFGAYDIRQMIGALAFLAVLIGVGLAGWIEAFAARLTQRRLAIGALVTAVIVILLIPDFNKALADAYNRTLPDRRNDLAHWMDISVPPGSYIAPVDNHKTFNREWGGYAGSNVFPYAGAAMLNAQGLAAARADGVTYAIIPYGDYQNLAPEVGKQVFLLKAYPPSPDYRGPDMAVLRLAPIQHPAQGQLGSIDWVGYDLNATDVTPEDTLQFTLYWQAEQPTDAAYVVYNHLIDPQTGAIVAQIDGDPLPDLRRPSSAWDDPTETLISRPFTLPLTDVPPGTYQLVTGFYRRDTGERLRSPQDEDGLVVASIHVHE